MKKLGTAIVLSGPSGVGKSTLVSKVRQAMPELEFSVSCTTRPPRQGEADHVHYHFLTDEEFVRKLEAGEFLEHAGIFTRRYGTLKSEVLDRVRRGADVILDIDVQGAMQIREVAAHDPDFRNLCEFVFIGPPSAEILEKRLRGRATESEEQIRLRLAGARKELSHWREYGYLVINDDLETAAGDLEALFRSFRLKTSHMPQELFS